MSSLLAGRRLSSEEVGWGMPAAALPFVLMLAFFLVAIQPAQAQVYKVLHNFVANPEGSYPFGDLIRDSAGNLYGTTELGAERPCNGETYGCGSVFKLSATGGVTVLHTFAGGTADGANSYASLIRDSAGNLYGTTYAGGANNWGTIFKVDPSGTETVLHSFSLASTDGANPYAGLVRDPAGNLYGTTFLGGSAGFGTVFKLDPSGTFTLLHSFIGGLTDGVQPYGGLILDSAGNLYGTTRANVFKIDPSGTLTTLYSFTGFSDGDICFAPVTRDSAGNLYGTTWIGGAFNEGIVFKVDPTGTETILWNFTGGVDGSRPQSGVVLDGAGNLYGTTTIGGANSKGVLFELDTTGTLTYSTRSPVAQTARLLMEVYYAVRPASYTAPPGLAELMAAGPSSYLNLEQRWCSR